MGLRPHKQGSGFYKWHPSFNLEPGTLNPELILEKVENQMKLFIGVLALIASLALLATAVSSTPSKEEIAKELANPNTVLTSLKLQIQYFSLDGDLLRFIQDK